MNDFKTTALTTLAARLRTAADAESEIPGGLVLLAARETETHARADRPLLWIAQRAQGHLKLARHAAVTAGDCDAADVLYGTIAVTPEDLEIGKPARRYLLRTVALVLESAETLLAA